MANKKRTSKNSRSGKHTYKFEGGQAFFGGGLDVVVEADSQEEALAKAQRAVMALMNSSLNVMGAQDIGGARCHWYVTLNEAFLGKD